MKEAKNLGRKAWYNTLKYPDVAASSDWDAWAAETKALGSAHSAWQYYPNDDLDRKEYREFIKAKQDELLRDNTIRGPTERKEFREMLYRDLEQDLCNDHKILARKGKLWMPNDGPDLPTGMEGERPVAPDDRPVLHLEMVGKEPFLVFKPRPPPFRY
ncbi:hypothetical protein CBS101457_004864 [Exobasidium rhododendri]|nr:hypothetical protein CBS101457_004864 [Exobasidium rhododendri]